VCGKKFIQNKLSIEFFPLKRFVGGGGGGRKNYLSINIGNNNIPNFI